MKFDQKYLREVSCAILEWDWEQKFSLALLLILRFLCVSHEWTVLGMAHLVNPFSIRYISEEQNELQLAKSFFLFECNKYRIEGWWRGWSVRVDALVSGFTRLSCLKLSIIVNDLGVVSQINIVICIIRYIQVSTLRKLQPPAKSFKEEIGWGMSPMVTGSSLQRTKVNFDFFVVCFNWRYRMPYC